MTKIKVRPRTYGIIMAIMKVVEEYGTPLTVRQIYYALTVMNVLPKNENGYRQAVYYVTQMRQSGLIKYSWIVDNTRMMHILQKYNSLEEGINYFQLGYHRDYWIDQPRQVIIWCEKDALAGFIGSITRTYGVLLCVSRGYLA